MAITRACTQLSYSCQFNINLILEQLNIMVTMTEYIQLSSQNAMHAFSSNSVTISYLVAVKLFIVGLLVYRLK